QLGIHLIHPDIIDRVVCAIRVAAVIGYLQDILIVVLISFLKVEVEADLLPLYLNRVVYIRATLLRGPFSGSCVEFIQNYLSRIILACLLYAFERKTDICRDIVSWLLTLQIT